MGNLQTVTRCDRTEAELQELWVFCLLSVGKNTESAKLATRRLLTISRLLNEPPFDVFRNFSEVGILTSLLKAVRCGQYKRVERSLMESMNLTLKTATREELIAIHGVGSRTVDFFLAHTRIPAVK
jgi:endonuclease III